jgi:signal peptidase II
VSILYTENKKGMVETMFYILIIIAIYLLDSIIKQYIEDYKKTGEQQEILNGKIILKKTHNSGMCLSFMENKKETVKRISAVFFGILLLVFAFLLPRRGNRLLKLGMAMLLGGAASNVDDRMRRGTVVDYFSFHCKKLKNVVFNLSDIFIFLGSALAFISSLCSSKTYTK